MAKSDAIQLRPLNLETIKVVIVGDTELIVHSWSEKAKKEMLAAQQKNKIPKEVRDPEKEYQACFYRIDKETYGFPTLAIKGCLIGAAHKDIGIEKTKIRQAVKVLGDANVNGLWLAKVHGTPEMREDMVTIGMGSADLRYRPMFFPWKMDLTIQYNKDLISLESLINLVNLAGFGIGIGEWRPEKNGQSGTFHVETEGN